MTQPNGDGTDPANSGDDGSGGGGGVTLHTKQELDHAAAQARRGALDGYFKAAGIDKPLTGEELQAALAAAAEHRKVQDGQKTDVERLTTEKATVQAEADKVPGLTTQLLRAQLAGDAGLKSRYWKYIEGDDEEAIKASIKDTLADIRGGGDGAGDDGDDGDGDDGVNQPNGQKRQGTGGLTPNPQQGAGSGGTKVKTSMSAGREAYQAKRKKSEE